MWMDPVNASSWRGRPYLLHAWNDDGWILGILEPDERAEEDYVEGAPYSMVLISDRDGELRILKEVPEREVAEPIWYPDLSSDSRYVAYGFREGKADVDLYVLSTVTGRETRLTDYPGNEILIGWIPGQEAILFYHDSAVWRLSLSEGEPVGSPEMVRGDVWGMNALGFTEEGLVYEVVMGEWGLYTVSLDLEAGRVEGALERIATERREGPRPAWAWGHGQPAWSPDSHFLASVERGLIVIRDMESGETREVSVPFERIMNLQWDPEGKSIFFLGDDGKRSSWLVLHKLDLGTEEVSLVSAPTDPETVPELGRARFDWTESGATERLSPDRRADTVAWSGPRSESVSSWHRTWPLVKAARCGDPRTSSTVTSVFLQTAPCWLTGRQVAGKGSRRGEGRASRWR